MAFLAVEKEVENEEMQYGKALPAKPDGFKY